MDASSVILDKVPGRPRRSALAGLVEGVLACQPPVRLPALGENKNKYPDLKEWPSVISGAPLSSVYNEVLNPGVFTMISSLKQ